MRHVSSVIPQKNLWHDSGKAPEAIIATGKAFPGKSQPLCAYPKVATYSHGDVNKAESFVCK